MREVFATVILLGVLQGGVLCAVLARRQDNRLPNRVLAALVAAVTLMLLFGYAEGRWGFNGQPHWLALGSPLPYSFGPLLYLYIVALTRPLSHLRVGDAVHATPMLAFALYMAQVFFFEAPERKVALLTGYVQGRAPVGITVFDRLQVTLALTYHGLSFRELSRYRRKMQGYYSDLSELDLRWLWRMVFAHTTVWSLVAAGRVVEVTLGHLLPAWGLVVQLGAALVIFLTGYIALSQREVGPSARAAEPTTEPEAKPEVPTAALSEAPSRPKYQRNRLADDDANDLARRVTACMVERELFRDAALTLQTLADELAVTPHALSQVLNVHLGKNFYTFVKAHRGTHRELRRVSRHGVCRRAGRMVQLISRHVPAGVTRRCANWKHRTRGQRGFDGD